MPPLEPTVPTLRGVLHAGAFPLALAAGIVLVTQAPTGEARVGTLVFAVAACVLFGTSALYHLHRAPGRRRELLRRLDHASIYLLIAGTYTPLALIALEGGGRAAVLWAVWIGAGLGAASCTLWTRSPRWAHTPTYVALGWVAAFSLPALLAGAGVAAFVLVAVGGALYTFGGLVYGLGRPNPAPRVFGFHEVFHALTVVAFAAHYVAVSLVAYSA